MGAELNARMARCTMTCAADGPTAGGAPLLLVVLVGIPGSGKSTFARELMVGAPQLQPGRKWCRVSQDVLGSRRRCLSVATQALSNGQHVIIDRCNFDEVQRAHWLNLRSDRQPDRRVAVYLPIVPAEARRRVLGREAHEGGVDSASMSKSKITSIVARMNEELQHPRMIEGFDEVLQIDLGEAYEQQRTEALDYLWALASPTLGTSSAVEPDTTAGPTEEALQVPSSATMPQAGRRSQ